MEEVNPWVRLHPWLWEVSNESNGLLNTTFAWGCSCTKIILRLFDDTNECWKQNETQQDASYEHRNTYAILRDLWHGAIDFVWHWFGEFLGLSGVAVIWRSATGNVMPKQGCMVCLSCNISGCFKFNKLSQACANPSAMNRSKSILSLQGARSLGGFRPLHCRSFSTDFSEKTTEGFHLPFSEPKRFSQVTLWRRKDFQTRSLNEFILHFMNQFLVD